MIKLGIVGLGAMGRNHARVAKELGTAKLVAVADLDGTKAKQIARLYGVRSYTDHQMMFEKERLDAVIVATPTREHCRVALDAMNAGCHVLVEKPIAATMEEAEAMLRVSNRTGRLLAVGYIERCNPAVRELWERLRAGELEDVFQCLARRLGPFPPHVVDVGVAVDLVTHDIDVMCYLLGQEIVTVYAETNRFLHPSHEDMLNALVRFSNGVLGGFEVSWVTPTKIRELFVTGKRGMFRLDYLMQDLFFYSNAAVGTTGWETLGVLRGVGEGTMVRYMVQKKEPLRVELEEFLAAVVGAPHSLATGEEGIYALKVALAMVKSGLEHQPVILNPRR